MLQRQMNLASVSDVDKWLAERKSFTNCLDTYDKVAFNTSAVRYLQSRLLNLKAVETNLKSPKMMAHRHADEMNAYRELLKIDRNRTAGLVKRVDDRLALARSQFKKKSFRVNIH